MSFALDERLKRDTFVVGDMTLTRVLLMNDARWPWLILVPRREGLVELIDLDVADRTQLIEETARAARFLGICEGRGWALLAVEAGDSPPTVLPDQRDALCAPRLLRLNIRSARWRSASRQNVYAGWTASALSDQKLTSVIRNNGRTPIHPSATTKTSISTPPISVS